MNSELIIISNGDPSPSDRALSKFAQFLGVRTRFAASPGEMEELPGALSAAQPGDRCLALSFAALKSALKRPWLGKMFQDSQGVFVYGFDTLDASSPEFKWLTQGAVSSIVSVEASRKDYFVHSGSKCGAFPVCGKSYSVETHGASIAFSGVLSQGGLEPCVSVNGLPCALVGRLGSSSLFCMAETRLADIDAVLTPMSSMKEFYAQFVVLAIFFRSAFGPACWTSPVRGATIIIDDPSLKRRYGFVCYEDLLAQLKKTGCALSVAFIPYNYRRSDARTVQQLLGAQDRFSIAIHGCDHTGGEFANVDEQWLAGLSQCARERMESHAKRTGMRYDDVMVFPQGRFSTKAMRVLKKCRYLAAVNSSPWPVDGQESALRIRDILDLAITRYDSFPLFLRRYPHDIFDLAFDALFQKPLLSVEHHEYFRSGYEPFADFVREINAIEAKLVWMPLRRTLISSSLMRQTGKSRYEVRFVTPVLRFMNLTDDRSSFLLVKPETSKRIVRVLWGGQNIPFEVHSGSLSCEIELDPSQEGELEITYDTSEPVHFNPSLKYRGRVFVRRLLSDVRDNYLSRSSLMLSGAKKAKKLISRKE